MLDHHLTKIADEKGRIAGYWNVFFLGISLQFASLLISWPSGLYNGFWPYFVSTLIIGVAYCCIMLCLAEMTSILPFSGGAYGFVRVTTYPYLGFLVGAVESFANIMYVAIAIVAIGEAISFTFNSASTYEPIYWLLIYLLSLTLLIFGDQSFFTWTTSLGIISLVLVVLYLLASSSTMDFDHFIIKEEYNEKVYVDLKTFVSLLPISSWFFVGIDTLPLACSDTKMAKQTVPFAMTHCTYVVFLFSLIILVAVSCQTPGMWALLDYAGYPLNMGYAQAFHMSARLATLLSLPGLFISNYAFMYAYAKQLFALSRSKLMPSIFSYTYGRIKMPHVALIYGAVVGYVIVLIVCQLTSNRTASMNTIYNACQMGSFLIYCCSFCSYIIFRVKYHTLERKFRNPFGIASAVLGMVIFAFAFVGVAFLQEDGFEGVITFGSFIALTTAVYFLYARHHQCYSPEESSIMFIIYVIKANVLRKRAISSRVLHIIKHYTCCCIPITTNIKLNKVIISGVASNNSGPRNITIAGTAASGIKSKKLTPSLQPSVKPEPKIINVSREDNSVTLFEASKPHRTGAVDTNISTAMETYAECVNEDDKGDELDGVLDESHLVNKPMQSSTGSVGYRGIVEKIASVAKIVPVQMLEDVDSEEELDV